MSLRQLYICFFCHDAAKENLCLGISRVLVLLATLSVKTCTFERSVRALSSTILKTYLRSTMGEERLSGLALLHTHYDMVITTVTKVFFRKLPRKIISPNRKVNKRIVKRLMSQTWICSNILYKNFRLF